MFYKQTGAISPAPHLRHGLGQLLELLQVGLVGVGAVHRGGSLIALLLQTRHRPAGVRQRPGTEGLNRLSGRTGRQRCCD